jgi:hypothetical protein
MPTADPANLADCDLDETAGSPAFAFETPVRQRINFAYKDKTVDK